jgi:hypothetical protein
VTTLSRHPVWELPCVLAVVVPHVVVLSQAYGAPLGYAGPPVHPAGAAGRALAAGYAGTVVESW